MGMYKISYSLALSSPKQWVFSAKENICSEKTFRKLSGNFPINHTGIVFMSHCCRIGRQSLHRSQRPLHSWTKHKKSAKNECQEMCEINLSYSCLQRFDTFWMCRTYNEQKRNPFEFEETCMEKLVKSLRANLFLASFNHCWPLCGGLKSSLHGL